MSLRDVIKYEEIKLVPSYKTHSAGLVFMVPEGALHTTGGEGDHQPRLQPCDLHSDLPAKSTGTTAAGMLRE